jgi:predicted metal-binding membrane protein
MSIRAPTWYGAVADYLALWMAMMVPMMLPSLMPMLSRYQRAVRADSGAAPLPLTAVAAAAYFVVWALVGGAACLAEGGLGALRAQWEILGPDNPVPVGVVLLVAGVVQLSAWKARQLARCRDGAACGRPREVGARAAWRYGLRLGVRCSLCCGSLMLALLACGMMNLLATAAVMCAISAERLASAPLRVARLSGVAILAAGLLTIARGRPGQRGLQESAGAGGAAGSANMGVERRIAVSSGVMSAGISANSGVVR